MLLAAAAVTVAVRSAGSGPWVVSGAGMPSADVRGAFLSIGALVLVATWYRTPRLRPIVIGGEALLVLVVVPGPHVSTALLLGLPVLAVLAAALLETDGMQSRPWRRSVVVAAIVGVVVATSGPLVQAAAALEPDPGRLSSWIRGQLDPAVVVHTEPLTAAQLHRDGLSADRLRSAAFPPTPGSVTVLATLPGTVPATPPPDTRVLMTVPDGPGGAYIEVYGPDAADDEAERLRLGSRLVGGELLALWLAGRFSELESRAAELHRQSLMAPDWAGDAVAALHSGWAELAPGRVPAACRWLAEATAGFRRRDPLGLLPLCASQLAQTCGLLGDAAGAVEALRTVDAAPISVMRAFEPQMLLGRAWATVATAEDRREAVETALRAARTAADLKQWAIEAMVLQAVVQLGRPGDAASRLRQLAAQLDDSLVSIYADHAEAAVAGSGARLDAGAADYERAGALLAAADVSALAAAAHRRRGHQRKASAAAVKAAKLAGACGRPRTPALVQLSMPRLTLRETEVARHASDGLNNQEIAAHLVLSVRTVEAHLANVYTKLGITSRTQLRDALAATAVAHASASHT